MMGVKMQDWRMINVMGGGSPYECEFCIERSKTMFLSMWGYRVIPKIVKQIRVIETDTTWDSNSPYHMLGSNTGYISISSFLLMHTLGGSRRWLRFSGSYHSDAAPGWVSESWFNMVQSQLIQLLGEWMKWWKTFLLYVSLFLSLLTTFQ